MKRNVMLMLWLASIVLLAWCGDNAIENVDTDNQWDITAGNNIVSEDVDAVVDNEDLSQSHPEWVATSLTIEDLKHIEENLPPLSYKYQTFDMDAGAVVNEGSYELAEGAEPVFMIPEYATMADREVISSWIQDDMIYTLVKMTLQDDTVLDVLYVNEPDTLFCRAINVENGNQNTLYTDFVYDADIE